MVCARVLKTCIFAMEFSDSLDRWPRSSVGNWRLFGSFGKQPRSCGAATYSMASKPRPLNLVRSNSNSTCHRATRYHNPCSTLSFAPPLSLRHVLCHVCKPMFFSLEAWPLVSAKTRMGEAMTEDLYMFLARRLHIPP